MPSPRRRLVVASVLEMADMEMEDAAPMEGLEEEKEEGEEDAPVIVSERQPERAEDMRHADAELRGAAGGRVGGREGVRQKVGAWFPGCTVAWRGASLTRIRDFLN